VRVIWHTYEYIHCVDECSCCILELLVHIVDTIFLKCFPSPIVLGQLTVWAFCINLLMSTGKWPLKLTNIFLRVKIMVFWNVTPFNILVRYYCFEGTFLLPLQDRRVTQDDGNSLLRNAFYLSTKLHGVTSQKTVILILTTARTSNHKPYYVAHADTALFFYVIK
jgi:hypothetical protein